MERAAKAASNAMDATKTTTNLLSTEGTSILLRLAQVANERELSSFWSQVAASKGNARQLLELNNAIEDEAILIRIHTNVHMTPSIKDKVFYLQYALVNRGDWLSSLGPFVFGTGTPEEVQTRLSIVAMYEFMNSGGEMPSLTGVNTKKPSQKYGEL